MRYSLADSWRLNNRVRSPEVLKSLRKIEKGRASKDLLRASLDNSSEAFAQMFDATERSDKMKAAKRGVNAFFRLRDCPRGAHAQANYRPLEIRPRAHRPHAGFCAVGISSKARSRIRPGALGRNRVWAICRSR